MFAVSGVFSAMRAYFFVAAGERVVARLRRQLFAAVIRQEIAFFDEQRIGELTNRLAADTTVLQHAVSSNISLLLRNGMMVIGGVAILVVTSWRLTLVMLSIVPVVVLAAVSYDRMLRALSREVQEALARSTEVAVHLRPLGTFDPVFPSSIRLLINPSSRFSLDSVVRAPDKTAAAERCC